MSLPGPDPRARSAAARPARVAALALVAAGLAATGALTAACGPPTAQDQVREVMELRNQYDLRLGSWVVRDQEGRAPHLYLDVSVVQNTEQGLATLTVMVEQLDEDNELLRRDRVVLDTRDLTMNLSRSVGVEVRPAHPQVEGVRLYVEPNPPEDVWDEFPEFERVRPRI